MLPQLLPPAINGGCRAARPQACWAERPEPQGAQWQVPRHPTPPGPAPAWSPVIQCRVGRAGSAACDAVTLALYLLSPFLCHTRVVRSVACLLEGQHATCPWPRTAPPHSPAGQRSWRGCFRRALNLELALSDVGTTGPPVGVAHPAPARPPTPGPSAGAGTCWGFWFLLF